MSGSKLSSLLRKSEPFSAVRNDYRYDNPTWGKGINTVLMVNNDNGEARTTHIPVYYQPRVRSRNGFDTMTDTGALAIDKELFMSVLIETESPSQTLY